MALPPTDREPEELELVKCDTAIRDQLLRLRESGWSNSRIGKKIGYSDSAVSQYLNDAGCKYVGDIVAFENSAAIMIEDEAKRRSFDVTTTDCPVAVEIARMCGNCKDTNSLAEVLAESGVGKSRALQLFVKTNPSAILLTCRSWSRDAASVEDALLTAVGRGGWNHNSKRAVYIVRKLMGSDRLIIVDNAEYLTMQAIHWLYDLQEETRCPMVFIGTFALSDKLECDERRASRTWCRFELTAEDPDKLIWHHIHELAPTAAREGDELFRLCRQVAKNAGHFRSVYQQLKMAAKIKQSKPSTSWVEAFKQAHTQLIRDYKLL